MAKIVYVEVNRSNRIIAIHNDKINAENLPTGHLIFEKNAINPEGLLGLSVKDIDKDPNDRPLLEISQKKQLRIALTQLSIELDLMDRLNEDTSLKQAEFDELKLQYEAI